MTSSERCRQSVVLVAGLGNKVANFAPLATLGNLFEQNEYEISHVDGAYYRQGVLHAASPEEQTEQILDQVRAIDKPLIIAHSIGSLAALATLRQRHDARAVMISPPLPQPASEQQLKVFMSRLTTTPDRYLLQSHSFGDSGHGFGEKSANPATVTVPRNYFSHIFDTSDNFSSEVSKFAQEGRLRLIIPVKDWNQDAVNFARGITGTHDIEAPHSLYVSPEEWPDICRSIYRYATQEV